MSCCCVKRLPPGCISAPVEPRGKCFSRADASSQALCSTANAIKRRGIIQIVFARQMWPNLHMNPPVGNSSEHFGNALHPRCAQGGAFLPGGVGRPGGAPGLQNQRGAQQSPRWVRFPSTSAKLMPNAECRMPKEIPRPKIRNSRRRRVGVRSQKQINTPCFGTIPDFGLRISSFFRHPPFVIRISGMAHV